MNEIADKFSRINLPQALQEGAQAVERNAAQVCPVRTGYLRSSIGIGEQSESSIEIAAEADYAGYVEFGTSRMQARRYMEQGMLNGAPEFEAAVGRAIADALG